MTISINYKLNKRLPHQKEFGQCKTRGSALVTGYGGGKTYSNCDRMIVHSVVDNGMPHMIVSPSFPQAKKTTIPTIHETLKDQYKLREGKDYKYNKSDHEFKIYKWNGLIWVGSGSNPDSLNGPNLASFSIDEPGQQSKDVYTKMLARLRHPKAKWLQWWLSGTPEGLNWFYDICEGEDVPKDFTLVRGDTRDNTHLPQSFIDDLLDNYDERLVMAYLQGLFVNMASGPAYYGYNKSYSLIGSYEPNKSRPLLIGMDFNYDPMCSVIAQEAMIDGEWKLVVFDEFFLRNCDTDPACEQIIEKYGSDYKYEIYPDPACYSGAAHGAARSDLRLIQNAFSGYKYWIPGKHAAPRRKERANCVNKMFKNSKGIVKMLIAEGCKEIKEDLNKCTMTEFLNGKFKDPMRGHLTDGLGYLVSKKYPIQIERPYIPNIL